MTLCFVPYLLQPPPSSSSSSSSPTIPERFGSDAERKQPVEFRSLDRFVDFQAAEQQGGRGNPVAKVGFVEHSVFILFFVLWELPFGQSGHRVHVQQATKRAITHYTEGKSTVVAHPSL